MIFNFKITESSCIADDDIRKYITHYDKYLFFIVTKDTKLCSSINNTISSPSAVIIKIKLNTKKQ